ncbi:ubiquitinyl hydrolase 1 [Teratosphaeriaceae sp. CCFEE 6253]|nr:ubiquitinyl hydrolase 1 [Teratosphaeriaceae sp. CCFEE 6253]
MTTTSIDASMTMSGMPMETATSGSTAHEGMMGMSDMMMVFFTASNTPLYSSAWSPSSVSQYAGTCIFLIILAAVFRGLLALRCNFTAFWTRWTRRQARQGLRYEGDKGCGGQARRPWRVNEAASRAMLDTVLAGVSYLLMLAVMTMNIGYFLSILGGFDVEAREYPFGRCEAAQFTPSGRDESESKIIMATSKGDADSYGTAAADVPKNKKRFIPLENNPVVMGALLHKLGLSPNLQFHDVFSIDDPDLLAFVPRPAYALLLVFPVSQTYEKFRYEEDQGKQEYQGSGDTEKVVWYKQTIGNACGLIGLLHGVSNGAARAYVQDGSELDKLIKKAVILKPVERAELLEDTHALETAHQEAANLGDTAAPSATDEVDLHYVCFVKDRDDGHLWEMDGRRKGPLDRGALDAEDDVLSENALQLGVRAFLKREEEAGGGELRFSLIVLAEGFD